MRFSPMKRSGDMKKIIVHSNYSVLNKHGNMLNGVGNVSVKDFLKQMWEMRERGAENGIDFLTSDQLAIDKADAFLFVDMPELDSPYFSKAIATNKPTYLLAWESSMINPRNSEPRFHDAFRKVFTYDDTLLDGERYIKVPYCFEFPEAIPKRPYDQRKLCCLIVGNKISGHPLELYSSRLETIAWFEANHPDEFDLYGQGWNKFLPSKNLWQKIVNNVPMLSKYLSPKRLAYRGEVDDKLAIYQEYLFAICYENARDLPGYISEKIFDCFFGGCVPIYWGAPNITSYIPETCFIDRRKFGTHAELYEYLRAMKMKTYLGYLSAIEDFLKRNHSGIFSVDYFARTIVGHIQLAPTHPAFSI